MRAQCLQLKCCWSRSSRNMKNHMDWHNQHKPGDTLGFRCKTLTSPNTKLHVGTISCCLHGGRWHKVTNGYKRKQYWQAVSELTRLYHYYHEVDLLQNVTLSIPTKRRNFSPVPMPQACSCSRCTLCSASTLMMVDSCLFS